MIFNQLQHLVCGDEVPSFLGIFDFSTAHPFLFYSYIPIMVISGLIGFFIYKKDKKSLRGKLFLSMALFFILWILNILVQWVASYHVILMFAWQLTAILEVGLFLSTIYLAYVFVNEKDLPKIGKFFLWVLAITVIVLTPTTLNVGAYDVYNCEGVVGPLWDAIYIFEPAAIIAILYIGFSALRTPVARERKRQITLFTGGLAILLGTFFVSNFYGELTKVYEFNFWGPIGMLVFFVVLGYMIVRFRTFNIKLFATQALVLLTILLIGSQLFYKASLQSILLNATTLLFFTISGVFLIRSVKREIQQKERLQVLTNQLEQANEKLKSLDKLKTEFLSLASHQLRSPLTAIKGYASMLDEGAFGKLNEEQDGAVKRVYSSAQGLANLVEDLLNVSKIEQGGMKYEFMATDIAKAVVELAEEMRIPAENKKLELRVKVPTGDSFMTMADPTKITQVFLNLIDNSIKYTSEGFIEVGLRRDEKKNIVFYVKDSGVGVTPETKAKLFEKFSRGAASKMNTGGSGLGLYLAYQIAKAHKGDIQVESEGIGKGTTFLVILPPVNSQK